MTATFAQQLQAFMKAVLQQESSGNYNAAGGGGYQFEPATWRSAAQAAGVSTTQYPTANSAPAQVQDQVAAHAMTSYYNGAGAQDWTKVAEIWNGGQPYPIPNPALGPGATTATYAAQVIKRFESYLGSASSTSTGAGSGSSGSSWQSALGDVFDSSTGGLFSWPGEIIGAFSDVDKMFATAYGHLVLFFKPSTYVRIGAGVFGLLFVVLGIVALARETKGA